jgi:hypothetical protein
LGTPQAPKFESRIFHFVCFSQLKKAILTFEISYQELKIIY